MKQFTTPEQTAKLIELGLPKPKSVLLYAQSVDCDNNYGWKGEAKYNCNYSIGELIEMLPPIIPQGSGYYINLTHDSVSWVIDYQHHGDTQSKYIVSDVELIDDIFAMIVELKEEGVI